MYIYIYIYDTVDGQVMPRVLREEFSELPEGLVDKADYIIIIITTTTPGLQNKIPA